jgi:hypothetical protein
MRAKRTRSGVALTDDLWIAQLEVPVWGGQITHGTSFSFALTGGEGMKGYDPDPCSTAEIGGLWSAIEKSVKVITVHVKGPQCIAPRPSPRLRLSNRGP